MPAMEFGYVLHQATPPLHDNRRHQQPGAHRANVSSAARLAAAALYQESEAAVPIRNGAS